MLYYIDDKLSLVTMPLNPFVIIFLFPINMQKHMGDIISTKYTILFCRCTVHHTLDTRLDHAEFELFIGQILELMDHDSKSHRPDKSCNENRCYNSFLLYIYSHPWSSSFLLQALSLSIKDGDHGHEPIARMLYKMTQCGNGLGLVMWSTLANQYGFNHF